MSEKKPPLVLVTGCHRSGTSAMTRCLNLMGLEIGGFEHELLGGNHRGHWENVAVRDMHEAALANAGVNWMTVKDVVSGPDDGELALRLAIAMKQLTGRLVALLHEPRWQGPRLVKDPRAVFFIPAWVHAALGAGRRLYTVGMWRSAPAVAQSLANRNRLGLAYATEIAKAYQTKLMAELSAFGSEQMASCTVPFKELMISPTKHLERIWAWIFPDRQPVDGWEENVQSYLDKSLVHCGF